MSTASVEESSTLVAAVPAGARGSQPPTQMDENGGYLLGERFASGGMGGVHLGLKLGALGFQRVVAIKRLHAHLVEDADFVARFKSEIRLVSRLSHQNIVQTLDVVESDGELSLVMEYVEGVTLYDVLKDAARAGQRLSLQAVVGIVSQTLHGLHAAHEALGDDGHPLNMVHRDVSPQNIMVGKDGLVKILDFGVAKARSEHQVTRTGEISGKVAYMSPEQASARPLDRRSDVFSAGIVLWEALTGERLFRPNGAGESEALFNLFSLRIRPPSEVRAHGCAGLDAVALRALERDPARRFGSARDFALALEQAVPAAQPSAVASALAEICGERMAERSDVLNGFRQRLRTTPLPGSLRITEQRIQRAPAEISEPAARLREIQNSLSQVPAPLLEAELQTQDLKGVLVPAAEARSARTLRARVWVAVGLVAGIAIVLLGRRLGSHEQQSSVPEVRAAKVSPLPVTHPQPQSTGVLAPAARSVVRPPPAPAMVSSAHSSEVQSPVHVDQLALQPRSGSKAGVAAALSSRPRTPSPRQSAASPASTSPSEATARVTPTAVAAPSSAEPGAESAASGKRSVRASAARVSCSPPSYTDAQGIRHFKPECL